MTVSSTNRKTSPFAGNGSTTAFPFSFRVFSAADLYAVQTVTSTQVQTVLTLTTQYTVVLNTDQNSNPGGTLTLVTPTPVGSTLVLTTLLAYLQSADIANQGGFYPEVIEDAFDKLCIYVQQLAESQSRSIVSQISSTQSGIYIKTLVANQILQFNAAGTAIDSVAIANVVSSAYQGIINNPQSRETLSYDSTTGTFINSTDVPQLNTVALATSNNIAYTAAFVKPYTALATNQWMMVRMPAANCGATPTLNVDGLGAINIVDSAAANLGAGALLANQIYLFSLNSAKDKWVQVTGAASGGGLEIYSIRLLTGK